MQNPNAIVSTVIRLDVPPDQAPAEMLLRKQEIPVELEGGRRVRLDPADERSPGFAQILGGLSRQRLPVYLEVDASNAVTRLLIPHVSRVTGIRPGPRDTLLVELEMSHAVHVLRRDDPDFAASERGLREALERRTPVIVSETDGHAIIDVRGYTPGPEEPDFPFPEPELPPRLPWPLRWIRDVLRRIWWWPRWPWSWFGCISAAHAQQVFNAMSATSCAPLTVPPPCIPFLYPDDGCWGRAHEMCRLMIDMGLSPRKVWIQGTLCTPTKNNPACGVGWGWHVAPTLCVRGPWFFLRRTMVIDPSLFTTPVTTATWKGVQGDPNATLTSTAASIFHYFAGGLTDPTYALTNGVLATYRLQLQNRALSVGPPPYAACP